MKKNLNRFWCAAIMVIATLAVGNTAFAQATPGTGGSADAELLRRAVVGLTARTDALEARCPAAGSAACANDLAALVVEFNKIRPRVVSVVDKDMKETLDKIAAAIAELKTNVLDHHQGTLAALHSETLAAAAEVVKQLEAKYGEAWLAAAKRPGGDCAGMADRLLQLAADHVTAEAGLAKALEACLQQGSMMVSEAAIEALQERGGVVRIPGGMLYVNSPLPDVSGGRVTRSVLGAVGGALGGAALGCGVGGAIRQSEDSPNGFQTSGCGYGSLIGAPVGALVGYLIAH